MQPSLHHTAKFGFLARIGAVVTEGDDPAAPGKDEKCATTRNAALGVQERSRPTYPQG